DGAAADLPAALAGLLHAAVVAPFAGVVHVGLALLEQLAMARERIDTLRTGDRGVDLLLDALLAVGPLDREPLRGAEPFVIGDELRQPLERRRRFQHELLHGSAPSRSDSRKVINRRAAAQCPTSTSEIDGT